MRLGLSDKHVAVTGATSGIGERVARAFSEEGSNVTLIGRDSDRLRAVSESLEKHGRHACYDADLMSDGEPARLTASIVAERGTIDVLVHTVGGSLGEDDPLAPVAKWLEIWRLNAGIAIEMNNVAIPGMQKAGWGRIVMISSVDAAVRAASPAYAAAKAYLNSYVRTVSWRIAKHGIVLSGVLPGPTMAAGNAWDARRRRNRAQVEEFVTRCMPGGRLGTPEDLWPFVLLLASELNVWAVGTLVELDGGIVR